MNQVSSVPHAGGSNRENFLKKLHAVVDKIHATSNIDQIMLDLSKDMCDLFDADRLTIYAVSENRTAIESKIKTGLKSFKDFSLSISDKSIAGFVALSKKTLNISNVYDDAELKSVSPYLEFFRKVDLRSGYHSKQMLVAPLVNAQTRELLGVVQLINNRNDQPFSKMVEEGLKELCETLAVAFAQRMKPPVALRSKYHQLVADGVLAAAELELAGRTARRKGSDLQEVLVNEFQVKLSDLGESMAKFFHVPYVRYQEGRVRPDDELQSYAREYFHDNRWLLLEATSDGWVVLTTNPERIRFSHMVEDLLPQAKLRYAVTTHREFYQTIDQFFGATAQEHTAPNTQRSAIAEQELINRMNTVILDAFKQEDAYDIEIQQHADAIESRFHANGALQSISGKMVIDFRIEFPEQ